MDAADTLPIENVFTLPEPRGWICPRCNRVWSPYVSTCLCSGSPFIGWPAEPLPIVPLLPFPEVSGATLSLPCVYNVGL